MSRGPRVSAEIVSATRSDPLQPAVTAYPWYSLKECSRRRVSISWTLPVKYLDASPQNQNLGVHPFRISAIVTIMCNSGHTYLLVRGHPRRPIPNLLDIRDPAQIEHGGGMRNFETVLEGQ
jgi:hypothetical protein